MSSTGAAAKADYLLRISRAIFCAALLAFLICVVSQGTAQADIATSSVTGSDFTSVVIRQGSADGTVVATLVGEGAAPTAAATLTPDTEYYLCATAKKTSESTSADYVKLVVGDGAEGSLAANGINITNPPGGSTRTAGGIDSNSFDYLLASSDIADGTYGTDYNNGSPKTGVNTYKMADGVWEWRLKSSIAKDDTYSFNIGFKVDGAFCTGANKDIADALNLSIGSLSGAQGTTDPAIASTSDTLSLGVTFSSSAKAKNPYISLASTGTGISSGISSMGYNSYGFYPVVNSTADPQSLLYKSFEFDIVHPSGTAVSYIGFANDGLVKSSYNTARGAFSQTDTGTDVNGNIITHVTLSSGLVSSSASGFYYQMAFDDTIHIGDKPTVKFQNYKATGFDGNVLNSTLTSTCVFTIVDPTLDFTALNGTNRAIYSNGYGGTYNWNIGRSSILAYNELLTEGNLSNPTSSKTPYKKTIRATYNTTAAAANISLVTLPIGCESIADDGTVNWLTSATVNWEGKDASGITKTGSFTIARTDTRWRKDMEPTGHLDYLKLLVSDSEFASDGIVTFTKMTVDAGYLPANANTSSWTASNSYGANLLGAWGYFTDGNVGTQVKTYYECYNTESTAPINDKSITVYTEANSLPAAALETNVGTPSDNFAITAGGTVSIGFNSSGSATTGNYFQTLSWRLSSASLSNFATLPSDSASTYAGYTDTTLIVDPVVILKLPPGFTYSDLHFYKRVNGSASTSNEYAYTIQNISYLDTRTEADLAGWSLYKITFPADTIWGYYDIGGNYVGSSISIKFNTSESVETKQYYLDDLINVTCERNLYACGYSTPSTIFYTKADIFTINGGRQLLGVSAGSSKLASFGVGQLTKLIVENSAALTSNNGTAVADPTWRTYSSTDPNSITFLGRGSTGQVKVDVSNPSSTDSASDFKMLIPIPKKGQDLGTAFMSGPQNFDMTLSPNAASFASGDNANFTTVYVKVTSSASTNTSISKVAYSACAESEANAILVTRSDYPASGSNTLLFDFKIADGATISSGDRNIWRDAFSYTVGSQSIERTGSYVAAEVAASEVTGVVFNDTNRNGLKDDGEAVVSGVAVTATDQQGRVQNTTTDENGSYTFEFVRNDKIAVSLTAPADTSSSRLRFNVAAPATIPLGVVGSTVTGSSDGKTATATVACNDTTETANAAIAQSYSLTYNRNSKTFNKSLINDPAGSVPLATEYPSGATATVAAPTNDMACAGYSFAGWATSATATTPDYVAGNTIEMTADVTLYAVWSVNIYTIHFDYQGGTSASIMESKSWTYGTKLGTADSLGRTWPVNPTKEGWSFYKWEVADASVALGASTWYDDKSTRGVAGDIYMRAVYVQLTPTTLDKSVTVGTTSTVDAPALDLAALATITNKVPANTVTYTCTQVNGAAYNASTNTVPGMTLATTGKIYGTPTTPGTYTLTYAVATAKPNASFELTVNLTVAKNALGISVAADPTTVKLGDASPSTSLTATVTGIPAGATDFTGKVTFTATKDGDAKTITSDISPVNGVATTTWTPETADAGTWTITATLSGYGGNYEANPSSATCAVLVKAANVKSYTIHFDKNAADATGATVDELMVVDTSADLETNGFARTGYTFAGWNTKADGSGTGYLDKASVNNLSSTDGATVTLYAQWTANAYTVRFDANTTDTVTGTMADEDFTYGTAATLTVNAFSRTGYTFAGWNTKADGSGTGYLDKASVNNLSSTDGATVTLYAQWTANSHLVTYDTKGGTQAETNKRVTYGSAYGTLPTPVKSGYDFSGWYTLDGSTSGEWGALVNATTTYLIADDSTVHARWTEKTGYMVVYNTNGGTPPTIATKTVTWTQTNLLPDEPTRTGYKFGGWKVGSIPVTNTMAYSSLVSTDATKSVTLVAQWTPNVYTVTFNANGGTDAAPSTKNVTYGSIYGDLATTNRTGYAFSGWWTANGTTTPGDWGTQVLSTSAYQVDGAQTLYSQWTANTGTAYKVEHYKVSANGTSATSVYTENLHGTTDATVTATPQTYDGYTYQASFNQNGMKTTASAAIAADGSLVLKLYYTPNMDTKYVVEYWKIDSGKTIDDAIIWDTVINKTGTTDTPIPVAALAMENHRPVYTFDPTMTVYDNPSAVTPGGISGEGDTTARLYYVENANVTLMFGVDDAAHGAVDSAAQSLAPATGTATAVTATAGPGYTFAKWTYTDATHTTATDVTGATAATITATQIDSVAKDTGAYEATSFIANFTENSDYTVAYDTQGGTPASIADKTGVRWTDSGLLPADPTRTGCTFGGWYTDSAATGDAVTSTTTFATAANNTEPTDRTVTLYAKWTANSNTAYTVNYITVRKDGTTVVATEPVDKTGTTGAAVDTAALAGEKTYAGYTYDSTRTTYADTAHATAQTTTLPIAGDGSLVVDLYYVEGADVTIGYTAATGGSVDPASETLAPATGTAAGSTATASAGYTFTSWTDAGGDVVSTAATFVPAKVGGLNVAATYTANFAENADTAYTVRHYKVSSDGKSAILTDTENLKGTTNTAAEASAKSYEGYTYQSNFDQNGMKTVATGTIAGDGSLILTLYYAPNSYVVKFKATAGSGTMDNEPMTYGESKVLLANEFTSPENWHFVGWATSETDASTGTVAYSDQKSVINLTTSNDATVTLWAVWARDTHVVIFDKNANDAENPEPASGKYAVGLAYGDLATCTRPGYSLEGWYTEASSGMKVETTTLFSATADITLYAHWLGEIATIEFNSQGGSAVGGIEGKTGDAIADLFPADSPILAGHIFAGWYTADSGGERVTSYPAVFPVGVTTYYAHWTLNNYAVTFDSNGGSAVTPQSVAYESTATEPAAPERTGYTFGAWHLGTATGSTYDFETPVIGPIVLVASWTPISYDVTYDLAEGTLAAGGMNPNAYTADDTFTLSNPTRVDHLFSGWTGTGLSAATMKVEVAKGSTGNRSYTATWTAIDANKTPVVYDGNGADADVPADETVYRIGDTVKISNLIPERTGFNFVGWLVRDFPAVVTQSTNAVAAQDCADLTAQAADKLFAPGDTFIMPAYAPIVLVAQWSADSYLVSFDTGEGGSQIDPQTVENGTFATQPSDPVRAGYEFTGWYTDGTCSTAFDFGAVPITGATTIVAGWKATVYSITLDAGASDAILPDGEPTTYTIASDTFSILNPTRGHYTFAGWTGTDLSTPTLALAIQKGSTGDRTYTGTWAPAVYTVSFSTAVSDEVPAQQVTYGATAAKPGIIPVRDGYAFSGWYADHGCTEPFDFAQAITGDTTVWAGWTAKDSGGGALSGESTAAGTKVAKTSSKLPNTGDSLIPGLMLVSMLVIGAALIAWGCRRHVDGCDKGRNSHRYR